MSQATKRLKQALKNTDIEFRAFSVIPNTINEEERSVEGVIATEAPIREYDYQRYEYVNRTLPMSGCELPGSKQMPMLDCHARWSLNDQLGSIRNLRTEGDQLIGKLVFSKASEYAWTKVREGHVTDISVGFKVVKQVYVPEKTTQKIGGRDYTGPVNVATRWRPFEGSLTPIGADESAKLRGLDPTSIPQQDEDFNMNEKLRAFLLTRGMPTELSDDQAQEWILANPDKVGNRSDPPPKKEEGKREELKWNATEIVSELDKLAQKREEEREAKKTAFRSEIDAACDLADMPADFARQFYDDPKMDLAAVRAKVKAEKAERAKNGPGHGFSSPRVTREGRDDFRRDVLTSMMSRVFRGNSADDSGNGVSKPTQDAILPEDQRGKGAHDFDHVPITEIARRCLIVDGYQEGDVRRLDGFALATAIFRMPEDAGLERRDGGSMHNTGSFAYLTENTMNKSMRAGNMEARTTYQKVCNIGDPVKDFTKKNVYTTSAVGNLTAWPDGTKPDLASFMDYKDSYGVEAYAKMLEYTWQLFVNDDMSVIIKSPYKLGDACRRSVNAYFWGIVTANANLADGQALFLATPAGNRKKANYISSGLAVTVAALSALENLMRQQVGQNTREGSAGPDILNIEPKYLVTPTAIKNTAAAVVKSIADPASSNSNVHNPFSNALELLAEPLLDANSATAYYLAADPALVDGIELSFLQGFEQPRTWSGMDEKTLTRWFALAQVWGGRAIDHRGWAKQVGA